MPPLCILNASRSLRYRAFAHVALHATLAEQPASVHLQAILQMNLALIITSFIVFIIPNVISFVNIRTKKHGYFLSKKTASKSTHNFEGQKSPQSLTPPCFFLPACLQIALERVFVITQFRNNCLFSFRPGQSSQFLPFGKRVLSGLLWWIHIHTCSNSTPYL